MTGPEYALLRRYADARDRLGWDVPEIAYRMLCGAEGPEAEAAVVRGLALWDAWVESRRLWPERTR